jgi:hypothetical protein
MSEFKFACPVCGQHITADASASGSPLECPTCFQTLIIPHAPEFGDRKLILTAAKATTAKKFSSPVPVRVGRKSALEHFKASLIPVSLLVATGGVAFFLWHGEINTLANKLADRATRSPAKAPPAPAFRSSYPIPDNVLWSLNPTNAAIPSGEVVGSIHGHGFRCERAVLKGDRLSLRQGAAGPPDLGFTVTLSAKRAEELSGKAILVSPNVPVSAPRVVLRWKDDLQEPVTQHFHSGYAMKLMFGRIADGKIYGRIYIALPDEQKSFAAGNFEAEVTSPIDPIVGK